MRITPEYLIEQKKLHLNSNYGVASIAFAPIVKQIIEQIQPKTLTDYGAGKCMLQAALGEIKGYQPYDPAFNYGPPKPADLVVCIDVLEHVEPDCLDAVLDDLWAITRKIGFFSIHTGAAKKVLSDGRNAHLIQQPARWWLPKLCKDFHIHQLTETKDGFWVIVGALAESPLDTTQKAA